MSGWLYFIRPPRADFVATMGEDEQAIMGEHAEYLSRLCDEGVVVLGGPSVGEETFGICVLEAETEADARAVLEADPAVRSGLMSSTLHPLRISFLRGRAPL